METHTQAPIFTQEWMPELLLVNIAAPKVELMEELNMTIYLVCNNGKSENYNSCFN